MKETEAHIEELLLPYSGQLAKFAQQLRAYFIDTKPNYELIGQSRISLNIGYSFTKKAWDSYAAIIIYSKHINISFPSGAYFEAPNSLLIGKGKRVRHIKALNIEEMAKPEIVNLITTARTFTLDQLEESSNPIGPCQTIFKN